MTAPREQESEEDRLRRYVQEMLDTTYGLCHHNDFSSAGMLEPIVSLLRSERRDALEKAATLADERAKKLRRDANATANAGEGDMGSIEAATCLDAEAAGAASVAAAIRWEMGE